MPEPDRSSLAADVQRLRQLQRAGRHAEVLQQSRAWLGEWPDNRDLLLLAAISQRHLGLIDDAMATLDRLEQRTPAFSRLFEERGLCHVQRRQAPAAIEALLRAVNINPALPNSWAMLQGLYRLGGDAANAAMAGQHVATLKLLPPEVVTATALFSDGDLTPAEQIIRDYLLRHGDHPEAMRLLARIGMANDVLDDAEQLLAAVLQIAPDYFAARLDYAQTLVSRHKYGEARREIEALLRQDRAHPELRQLAATTAVGLGEHDRAILLYRAMLVERPDAVDPHLWLGHALKTVGSLEAAVAAYRAAARLRPDFGDAYWSLANLKLYRFTDDEIARMQVGRTAAATAAADRIPLCFALGKAFEDRDQAAEAWRCYQEGNALQRAASRYRPEIIEANTERQIAVCTPLFFNQRCGWGVARPDPIFILGLPRAGSTLIEQILASHSAVEGTQELADIQRMVLALQGPDPDQPRYPGALSELTAEEVRRLGESYLQDTQVYRRGKPRFIDKMPNNFRHIGLIHLILPEARIIDARREPMACCFSNLKQLFAQGQEFTYSIEDIARYYRTYLEVMRHWDRVLPGRVLRVHHQDVVDDLEGSVRRLLDHCGLAFEPACLDFHNTRRSVRTASSEQVRQPIFRDGLDQWQKFAPWLEPLRTALGDALWRYREPA